MALNSLTVKAIYDACMRNYLLQPVETSVMADKDMQNVIDETCHKTKEAVETENA